MSSRLRLLVLLTWFSAGCVTSEQERAQNFSNDGVFLFQHGDYRHALECFQAARGALPEDPGLWFNMGECYDHLGDAAHAEQCYRECLGRQPENASARHALVVLYVRTRRMDQAKQYVAAELTRYPKSAAAYAEDGWLLHQSGDLPRAQARLQQALVLDPHDVRALTEMAQIYEELHRPDRAVVLYEQVLEHHPGQVDIERRLNTLLASGAGRARYD